MGTLAQFFDLQQPPPGYAEPPQDAALLQRITKLVEFATRNGPSFVELIKSKQKDNAEYGFLFDGDGSAYYRYSLYCGLSATGAAQHPVSHAQPHEQQQQQAPPQQEGAAQQQQQQHQQHQHQHQQYPGYDQQQQAYVPAYSMPAEVAAGFSQVLSSLTGSRESIRSSAAWFLAAQQHAWGLAQQMAAHAAGLSDHTQRLHVVYLANDLLLKSLETRPAGGAADADAVAASLRPVLPGLLAGTVAAGGSTQEAKDRVVQIVHFWRDKGVHDAAAVAELEAAITTGQVPQPAAAPQHPHAQQYQYGQPYPQQQHQQQQQQQQAPHDHVTAQHAYYQQNPAAAAAAAAQQWGAPPPQGAYPQQQPAAPGVSPPQPAVWFPPPGATSAAMAPPPDLAFAQQLPGGYAPPPVAPVTPSTPPLPNPVGFPPGLLPQLVKARELSGSYTPIPAADVAAAQMLPPREPDAYLKSRLDQFYAELQDYRPGLTRADVEAQQRAQRRAEGRPEDSLPPERSHTEHARTFDGPPPRGSGGGGGGGGMGGGRNIGLGFEDEPRPQMGDGRGAGDQFEAFRQQRSSGYYDMIGRNSVEAMVKRGERFGGRG